jgi:hypothetical protein
MPSAVRDFWIGLPTAGRLAVVVGPLLVVACIIAAVSATAGHSDSWEYGYKHSDMALNTARQGMSSEMSCRGVAGMGAEYGGFDRDEVMAGCLAGMKDAAG